MSAGLAERVQELARASKGARRVFAVVDVEDLKEITAMAIEAGVPRYLLIAYLIHRGLEAVKSESGGR